MESKSQAVSLFSSLSAILWCRYYSFIITLQDFHSCFSRAFQLVSFLLFYSASWDSCYAHVEDDDSNSNEVTTMLTKDDVELVMGLFGQSLCYEGESQGLVTNITNMFDINEPSFEEVREAFDVFDANHDGFVDAGELKKVVDSIGARKYSEQECRTMIVAYDENGDERIDFGEFVKLMEKCLS